MERARMPPLTVILAGRKKYHSTYWMSIQAIVRVPVAKNLLNVTEIKNENRGLVENPEEGA